MICAEGKEERTSGRVILLGLCTTFREAGDFQSSPFDKLRAGSAGLFVLESLPRTASWAKFCRPSGTHLAIVSSHADAEARIYLPVP
jgi:hypothetical protein